MGATPLQLTDVIAYWQHVDRLGSLDEFISIIQKMDRLWLERAREQQKKR